MKNAFCNFTLCPWTNPRTCLQSKWYGKHGKNAHLHVLPEFWRIVFCIFCASHEKSSPSNVLARGTRLQKTLFSGHWCIKSPASQQGWGIGFQEQCDRMGISAVHRDLSFKLLLYMRRRELMYSSSAWLLWDVLRKIQDMVQGRHPQTSPELESAAGGVEVWFVSFTSRTITLTPKKVLDWKIELFI